MIKFCLVSGSVFRRRFFHVSYQNKINNNFLFTLALIQDTNPNIDIGYVFYIIYNSLCQCTMQVKPFVILSIRFKYAFRYFWFQYTHIYFCKKYKLIGTILKFAIRDTYECFLSVSLLRLFCLFFLDMFQFLSYHSSSCP